MSLVFEEVEETLSRFHLSTTASELHGMLTGLICAGVEADDIENWLPVLCLEDRYLPEDEYRPFEQDIRDAYLQVRKDLESFGVEFSVLLPEDGYSLLDRVSAMTSWCTGYLKAIVEYGEISVDQLPDDCAEFLDDVTQMSDIELEEDPSEEELEASYMTLEEHLRVGVQLVYEQLNMEAANGSAEAGFTS